MVGKSALNALFLRDSGENRRNQGKVRWEYPLGGESRAHGWARSEPLGFAQSGLNISKEGQKTNQIFRGRTEMCPENEGALAAGLSTKDEGRRSPVPSFSAPGGWRIPGTGSHWGLAVQSGSEKEKKGKKQWNSTVVGRAPILCWLLPSPWLIIILSVNVLLHSGSEGTN